MVELIIMNDYAEEELERLYYTPQDAFEGALEWVKRQENLLEEMLGILHPLETWDKGSWHDGSYEGFRLELSGWSHRDYKFIIVERKVYPLTA